MPDKDKIIRRSSSITINNNNNSIDPLGGGGLSSSLTSSASSSSGGTTSNFTRSSSSSFPLYTSATFVEENENDESYGDTNKYNNAKDSPDKKKKQRLSKGQRRRRMIIIIIGGFIGIILIPFLLFFDISSHHNVNTTSSKVRKRRQQDNKQQYASKNITTKSSSSSSSSFQRQQQQQNEENHQNTNHLNDDEPVVQYPFTGVRLLRKDIDYSHYTIRINTWERPNQLILSVNHHSKCDSVKQIQIVWCVDQNATIPQQVLDNPKVVVEYHTINSLNERFHILPPASSSSSSHQQYKNNATRSTSTTSSSEHNPLTYGILSIDDDVLRPCEAIDIGFMKWIRNPSRMVGYDARVHDIHLSHDNNNNNNNNIHNTEDKWKYGYMSTTQKLNQYSISLTRYCFIHVDYLYYYTKYLDDEIKSTIDKNFECEDIAMSFLISSLTNGKPPLLSDNWSVVSLIKLYIPSSQKISAGKNHKHVRDDCINNFATMLKLKRDINNNNNDDFHPLQSSHIHHANNNNNKIPPLFEIGAKEEDNNNNIDQHLPKRLNDLQNKVNNWKSSLLTSKDKRSRESIWKKVLNEIQTLKIKASYDAYMAGYIEKTPPWKKKFHK